MSDSVRPQRWQPTRLPCPWDFPGKNAGMGCHFLLQWMKLKSESEVTQSCPTLRHPMDCSLPGSSVHGIFKARALETHSLVACFCIYIFIGTQLWLFINRLSVVAFLYNSRVSKLKYLLPDSSRKILLTLFLDNSRNDQHLGKNLE